MKDEGKDQGISLSQGSNPSLLHWQKDSFPLSHHSISKDENGVFLELLPQAEGVCKSIHIFIISLLIGWLIGYFCKGVTVAMKQKNNWPLAGFSVTLTLVTVCSNQHGQH